MPKVYNYHLATDPYTVVSVIPGSNNIAKDLIYISHPLNPESQVPVDNRYLQESKLIRRVLNDYKHRRIRFGPCQDLVTLEISLKIAKSRNDVWIFENSIEYFLFIKSRYYRGVYRVNKDCRG